MDETRLGSFGGIIIFIIYSRLVPDLWVTPNAKCAIFSDAFIPILYTMRCVFWMFATNDISVRWIISTPHIANL